MQASSIQTETYLALKINVGHGQKNDATPSSSRCLAEQCATACIKGESVEVAMRHGRLRMNIMLQPPDVQGPMPCKDKACHLQL